MKKYWAYKWAKYLEQPGLRQARRVLAEGNAVRSPKCCLGHLEYMVGSRFKPKSVPELGIVERWTTENGAHAVLSEETRVKVGMSGDAGTIHDVVLYRNKYGLGYQCLAEINDAGVPLKEIAKIIRKHWRNL